MRCVRVAGKENYSVWQKKILWVWLTFTAKCHTIIVDCMCSIYHGFLKEVVVLTHFYNYTYQFCSSSIHAYTTSSNSCFLNFGTKFYCAQGNKFFSATTLFYSFIDCNLNQFSTIHLVAQVPEHRIDVINIIQKYQLIVLDSSAPTRFSILFRVACDWYSYAVTGIPS